MTLDCTLFETVTARLHFTSIADDKLTRRRGWLDLACVARRNAAARYAVIGVNFSGGDISVRRPTSNSNRVLLSAVSQQV